jgi:hypothetical protein
LDETTGHSHFLVNDLIPPRFIALGADRADLFPVASADERDLMRIVRRSVRHFDEPMRDALIYLAHQRANELTL